MSTRSISFFPERSGDAFQVFFSLAAVFAIGGQDGDSQCVCAWGESARVELDVSPCGKILAEVGLGAPLSIDQEGLKCVGPRLD